MKRASLVLAGVFGLAACGGGQQSAPPATEAPAAAPATTVAAATAPAAASDFGVPECDDYMAKYTACVDSKVPEAMRGQVRQGLEQTKAAWKTAAATPQGKAALATGCKQAIETAKASMKAYGCAW